MQINEIFVYDMSYSHIFAVTTLNIKKGNTSLWRLGISSRFENLFELVRPKDKNFI